MMRLNEHRVPIMPPLLALCLLVFGCRELYAAEKLKALIMAGQNNHAVWPKSTLMIRQCLEETGLFEVDIALTAPIWKWEREVTQRIPDDFPSKDKASSRALVLKQAK